MTRPLPLRREQIIEIAEKAAQADGDPLWNPHGMCFPWSFNAYHWLTDPKKRETHRSLPYLTKEQDICIVNSNALQVVGPFYHQTHVYCLLRDGKVLDPSISQFFSKYENLSEQILHHKEQIFFGLVRI